MGTYGIILTVISTISFIAALYFAYMLSKETKGEKYWVLFLISAVAFTISHILRHPELPVFFSESAREVLIEIMEVAGAFSFAYACYGLYSSMKRIRKKISEEIRD